jgi:hypothetical protein
MTFSASPTRLVRAHTLSISSLWMALFLFLLTLALRVPFMSQTLNHWDSVNHALALTSFNIAIHRPQPPGYIVYIGLGRLVNLFFPDPQTALVLLSVLASALAVALLFLLGTRMFSRTVGLVAALLLLTSPAFWFDGLVALPYVVEGCFSVALALRLYALWQGEKRLAPLTAVVFALAVGARQQMAFFFAPLVLYVYWRQTWRVRLEALLWFTFVCLVWFVPLTGSAGGLAQYLAVVRAENAAFTEQYVLFGTGGVPALFRNAELIGTFTVYAMNLSLAPFVYAVVARVRARHPFWPSARVRFLILWTAPSLVFYLFFHMGSPGLIYVYLSALFLVAANGVVWLTRAAGLWRVAFVIMLCAVNGFLFFGTPPDLYTGRDLRVLNYSSLREHDISLTARVNAIRQHFNPQTTLILSNDWRFAEYYLPEFRVLFFSGDQAKPLIAAFDKQEVYTRPANLKWNLQSIQTIVLFDAQAVSFYKGRAPAHCLTLADGTCLTFYAVSDARALTIRTDGLAEQVP